MACGNDGGRDEAPLGQVVEASSSDYVQVLFEDSLADGFYCPPRLRGYDAELVEQANLWHFAMLNDEIRNRFFWDALQGVVEGKRVLDVGTGSGLLAMMAAKLGATSVLAVEAHQDLAELAEINVRRNQLQAKVKVVHSRSTSVELPETDKVEVIVSELLGTLLNGERVVEYLADARERLARPGVRLIPAGGSQHCVLVSSASIEHITSVCSARTCHGLDLSATNILRDTTQTVNPSAAWGVQLAGLRDLVHMSERVSMFELDFSESCLEDIPLEQTYPVRATMDGIVHAVVATWEVWGEHARKTKLATHLSAHSGELNASRGAVDCTMGEVHFSQAVQLLEDLDIAQVERHRPPAPFRVTAGEWLTLRVRQNMSRTDLQFSLHRATNLE